MFQSQCLSVTIARAIATRERLIPSVKTRWPVPAKAENYVGVPKECVFTFQIWHRLATNPGPSLVFQSKIRAATAGRLQFVLKVSSILQRFCFCESSHCSRYALCTELSHQRVLAVYRAWPPVSTVPCRNVIWPSNLRDQMAAR